MKGQESASIYHLLARCFSYPDSYFADSLKGLVGQLRIEWWDDSSGDQPILPIAPLVRTLAALDRKKLNQLQQEYQHLFGGTTALCPLHAWAFRPEVSRESLVQDVQSIYTAWSWEAAPEDTLHLETELEFLAFLCGHVDDEAAQIAKRDFLYQQALVWLLRFADKVAVATRLDFYRVAARLLTVFLKLEAGAQFRVIGVSV